MLPEFDDGKAPGALRTIGEVARVLDIRQHVLRYWEEQFPMLRPIKRSGGRRYYRSEDIALIAEINRLVHREGFTLRGARQAMEASGSFAANEASVQTNSSNQAVPNFQDELRSIRDDLAAALARS
ncbi:MerR family transcriptional regulator [Novosphingobium sp. RD2P27]|uniref:MerR family transcriptional regulator n=1 Tax=Novosphingobium kalidii TaxID=3230299 RepID=A0ABV2D4X1_9SPHN